MTRAGSKTDSGRPTLPRCVDRIGDQSASSARHSWRPELRPDWKCLEAARGSHRAGAPSRPDRPPVSARREATPASASAKREATPISAPAKREATPISAPIGSAALTFTHWRGSMPSVCSRTTVPRRGVPFPPRGPGGPVPPLPRSYGTLRLPAVPLAALRGLRLAIPSFRPSFVPVGLGRRPRIIRELVSRVSHRQFDGNGRVSQVPRDPSCALALFFDPGGIGHARPWRRADAVPRLTRTRTPTESFRGSIARPGHWLSPLRSGSRLPPRQTRFRLLAKLCRAGFVHPQGSLFVGRVGVRASAVPFRVTRVLQLVKP
jgi:hypothetical protein